MGCAPAADPEKKAIAVLRWETLVGAAWLSWASNGLEGMNVP